MAGTVSIGGQDFETITKHGHISEIEFDILNSAYKNAGNICEAVSEKHSIPIGNVNSLMNGLLQKGLIGADMKITPQGTKSLEPYRVKNAVIMAAGMSTRFAPLSYEKPKALLRVKGELLIEREIRQLREAGIKEIIVVVGYMKEKLFYLADEYDVEIVVNEDYYRYNNTSTLMPVADRLSNTYICSSDNYFSENPFEQYVYRSYYSAVYAPGETDEYCISYDENDKITGVEIGGGASWYMIGHVYFDSGFSEKFASILKKEYKKLITKEQLWEDLYIRHIDELDMYIRRYASDDIKEFDSLEELRFFDKDYLANSDSKIIKNICSIFNCKESDITGIYPIKEGLTNLSFCFTCRKNKYVYRHPGIGTQNYVNRTSEADSMVIAKELGLDDTYIYINPEEGWKLSHYIEDVRTLDYHDDAQVNEALRLLRTLHKSGKKTKHSFDVWHELDKFEEALGATNRTDFEDMPAMREAVMALRGYLDADNAEETLCHCDSYAPNFLIDRQNKMYLIDWEYSGMSDPGVDIGTFIACSDYSLDEAKRAIGIYLEHEPRDSEMRRFLGYVAVSSFYWFLWALYQESVGKTVGEYLYMWYRYTKKYSASALELYRDNAAHGEEKGDGEQFR